jgi:hypothetical protein
MRLLKLVLAAVLALSAIMATAAFSFDGPSNPSLDQVAAHAKGDGDTIGD